MENNVTDLTLSFLGTIFFICCDFANENSVSVAFALNVMFVE